MTRQERIQEAREMLVHYKRAEIAVLNNQSYSIGGQSLTRADLTSICKQRDRWQAVIDSLTGGRQKFIRVIPVDD